MKMEVLLGKNKGFFKANLHCHSVKSDGKMTVEKIKEEYKKRGYSAVAFTDHDAIHNNSHLTDGEFIAITAAELTVKVDPTVSDVKMKCAHMNFYAMEAGNSTTPCYSKIYDKFGKAWSEEVRFDEDYRRVYSPEGINEMIRIGHEKGFLVSLNHPSWSLQNATDYLSYEGFDFIEICNTACQNMGYTDDENVFNDMVVNGKTVFCTAADDNHNYGGFEYPETDSFGNWVMIDAPSLDYSTIMTSLKNGEFYASSGPEIYSLTKDGMQITVKCSEAESISLITDSRKRSKLRLKEGESVTEASFELKEGYTKFRIVVQDKNGKKAYSQFYNVN